MLFISKEDFFEKADACQRLSCEQEKEYAVKMAHGDEHARSLIIRSYLPFVAALVRRQPTEMQTLELIYRFCKALEKAADGFDFAQEGETFAHRLSGAFRRALVEYIADK